MRKPRKVNTIKALKWEIKYYKRQLVPVNVIDRTQLKHIKMQTVFTPFEMSNIPKEAIKDVLINRMAREMLDHTPDIPIETSYDEQFNVYRVELDLWVKEKAE